MNRNILLILIPLTLALTTIRTFNLLDLRFEEEIDHIRFNIHPGFIVTTSFSKTKHYITKNNLFATKRFLKAYKIPVDSLKFGKIVVKNKNETILYTDDADNHKTLIAEIESERLKTKHFALFLSILFSFICVLFIIITILKKTPKSISGVDLYLTIVISILYFVLISRSAVFDLHFKTTTNLFYFLFILKPITLLKKFNSINTKALFLVDFLTILVFHILIVILAFMGFADAFKL